MKKRLVFIAAITILLSLLSNINVVYRNPLYTIRRGIGGSTFSLDRKIVFGQQVREALRSSWSCGVSMVERHNFCTVPQMFDRIQSENWTINDIDGFYYDENGTFDMFNIEKPMDAVLPADVRISEISWHGSSYCFSLEGDWFQSGYLFVYGQKELKSAFKDNYKNVLTFESKLSEKQGVTTVTGKHRHYGSVTIKRFDIDDGKRTLYIQAISSENKVEIYGFGDDAPFYVRLDNYTGPLSTDWLKCFGVTPIAEE